MAETFQSLMKSFRDVTHQTLKENKDTSVMKLLIRTVNSLETVLATFDKFLKSKNIDVGKAYEASKEKGKSLAESGKKFMDEAKEKGLKATITGKALDVKSKLGSIFARDKEKQVGPPADGEGHHEGGHPAEHGKEEKTDSKLNKVVSTFSDLADQLKDKLGGALGGKKPLEEKKSWLDRVKERMSKRSAEVEDEKKAVQEHGKKKGGGGWLGKILSGLMGVGGFIVKGMTKSMRFLGGFLMKGFSRALFRLVPGLSGGIAKATQAIVTNGLKLAGRGLMSGAGAIARAALPFAGQALGVAARGAAMLATGPVGWAIAIGTAVYAGYKLYKYLHRNDVKDDVYGKLTRLRLLMYGLNDTNKEYYSKVFDLEMIMKDYVKFSNFQIQITKLDSKAIDKILELFGVQREEKEKYAILNNWFMKRFIPAYKAFMTALWSVNSNIYLDEIDKLKPGNLVDFISKFSVPGIIFKTVQAPTGDKPDILVKKEDVDAMYTSICNDVKAQAPKEKTAEEKAREENRQAAAKQKQQADAAKAPATTPTADKQALKKETPVPSGKDASAPDAEGENKPNAKDDMNKTQAKAAGKLNTASGQLTPGGMTLEGISTKLDKSKIYNLDPNVRDLFTGMAKEYKALTGKDIPVNEAFRSYEDQEALYKKMPDKAAKPGNSTHEAGLAVDINSATSQELDKMGLLRKYGFSTSVGGEKWHIEPIGVTLNPTLAKKDENFRTKAVLSSPGHGGGGYGFLEDSILKKRDTNYQMSIYNSGSDNPIDVEKVAATNAAKDGNATGTVLNQSKSDDPNKLSTAGKTGTTKSDGVQVTSTKTETVTGGGSRTTYASNDGEGENKPSLPTSKTPIGKTDKAPSLDGKPSTGNPNMDIAKYATLPPEAAIKQAAKMTGMNEDTMIGYAKMESSMDPNAQAKGGTAGGLFGITDNTWEGLTDKYGNKYNLPENADKKNAFYSALMAGEYSKENLQRLTGWKQLGLDENTAMYLGHHFGASGANGILNKANQNPSIPIREAVSEKAYSSNQKELGNRSVGDYLNMLGQKVASMIGKVFKPVQSKGPTPMTDGSDAMTFDQGKMGGNDTTPKATGTSAPKTSAQSYMQRASEKTSISSSSYSSSMNNTPVSTDTGAQNTYKQMFDTSKMESVLGEQLEQMKSMVGLLRSIDGKFDGKAGAPAPAAKTPPPADKSIPNSSIDLSRKKLTA